MKGMLRLNTIKKHFSYEFESTFCLRGQKSELEVNKIQ